MSARATLRPFLEAELIEPLQVLFVEALERIGKEALAPEARIAIAFASAAPSHGHVAAHLEKLPSLVRWEADEETRAKVEALLWPKPQAMFEALSASVLVRKVDEDRPTPLVLDGMRLYLDRYFLDERLVYEAISERLDESVALEDEEAEELRAIVDKLFGDSDGKSPEQKQAVATALLRKLTVVTGGPGTGKTTTVVRLLAALQERNQGSLRIMLMAPTGKAAARMSESIRGQRENIDSPYRERLPTEARTLHRALGVIPHQPGRFRHDVDNPLPADVIVVDEASMIDLPMMARLFEALPKATHLILLGDRDQLASVAAGAVLGDICGERGIEKRLSSDFARELSKLIEIPPRLVGDGSGVTIADAVVELRHSHRFDGERGIGLLAKAINEGDAEAVVEALRRSGEVELVRLGAKEEIPKALQERIVDGFGKAMRAKDPAEALRRVGELRVLCAHRRGMRGVEALNRQIVDWLAEDGIVEPRGAFFHGRLVMVTENDYRTDLFNGDIGIVLRHGNELKVHFEGAKGEAPRSFSPNRLPAHETAFAMTIHKSQGSEFDEVVVVLPDDRSPIVTRELVYTGVTRAKQKVSLVGKADVLLEAVKERVERQSGLKGWLWNHFPG